MKNVKDDIKRKKVRHILVTEQVCKKWSKEMEVSVQAKTVELTEHWLAVGNELKLLQGENKARD